MVEMMCHGGQAWWRGRSPQSTPTLDTRQWSLAPLRPEPFRKDGRPVRTGVGSKGTAVTEAASVGVRWADKQIAHGAVDLFVVEVEDSEGR
jgi:hypothetical protein